MSIFEDWLALLFGRPTRYPEIAPIPDNPLAGKRLRYLIGREFVPRVDEFLGADAVTEVSYLTDLRPLGVLSIAYCNLFDENNTGGYGPYLHTSSTAAQYHEGQIDPRGPGWEKNLREQFERRKKQGFEYIELDNPDAYRLRDVLGAIDLAASYGLRVIAKNPGISDYDEDCTPAVARKNVYGIIVERGAGTPAQMHAMRSRADKPDLPVWFVGFGTVGRAWTREVAATARDFRNMFVSYSSRGEYENSSDVTA